MLINLLDFNKSTVTPAMGPPAKLGAHVRYSKVALPAKLDTLVRTLGLIEISPKLVEV